METEISDTQIMILVPSESLDSYKSMLSSLSPSCRYLSIYLVSSLSFSQKLSSDPLESNIKELQFNDKRTKKRVNQFQPIVPGVPIQMHRDHLQRIQRICPRKAHREWQRTPQRSQNGQSRRDRRDRRNRRSWQVARADQRDRRTRKLPS